MTDKAGLRCLKDRIKVRHMVFKKPEEMIIDALISPGSFFWRIDDRAFGTTALTDEWYAQVRAYGEPEGIVYTIPLRLLDVISPGIVK